MIGEAAEAFGFRGVLVPVLHIAGAEFTAVARLDEYELARRERVGGVSPVTDRLQLKVLFELPLDEPVAWDDLDPVLAGAIDALPRGVVEADNSHVVRRFRPAVTIEGVIKVAHKRVRAGLEEISWLAPDAARGLVAEPDSITQHLAHQAQGLGGGLAAINERGLTIMVAPSRRYIVTADSHRWHVAELVLDAWLKLSGGAPTP